MDWTVGNPPAPVDEDRFLVSELEAGQQWDFDEELGGTFALDVPEEDRVDGDAEDT